MKTHEDPDLNEAELAALLRSVGSRPEPSAQAAEEVRAAVHGEWRAVVAERSRRRRQVQLGLAASVLLALTASVFGLRFASVTPHQIASIVHHTGRVAVVAADDDVTRPASMGTRLVSGEMLTTGSGRGALRLESGLALRVDVNTKVRLIAQDRIELLSGAVYVDSEVPGGAQPLTIETAFGSVRHVGTQYQVHAGGERIEVLVRRGRVEISSSAGVTTGLAGERVQVDASGDVARGFIARSDGAWAWTTLAASPFDIEGRMLDEFLTWVARETGRELVYESPRAQTAARNLKLRGSISSLHPDAALASVLATTRLRRDAADDSQLSISLNSPH